MSEEKREASTNLVSVFNAELDEVVSLVKQYVISIG